MEQNKFTFNHLTSPHLTQRLQQINHTQLRMAVRFIGTEGDVSPDTGSSIECLGVEFPHVRLVGVGNGVFLTEVFKEGF